MQLLLWSFISTGLHSTMTKNILVLTYFSYKDALIQTYTLPYLRIIRENLPAGSKIFLVTLEQPHLRVTTGELNLIRGQLKQENIHLIDFSYSRFGFKAAIKWALFIARLFVLCFTEKITFIHSWCMTAGTAGYILSKVTGLPLIIDSYEPHADSMVENGTWQANSLAFKILLLFEKLESRHADVVIGTTGGMKEYAMKRYGADLPRFYVKPACVDLNMFSVEEAKDTDLTRQYNLQNKIVCVYAGKVGGIYLEKEIFDFFKAGSDYWGDKFRVLLLTDISEAKVRELSLNSGLDSQVVISKFVEHKDVPKHLALGDFAINPVKPVPTKQYCTSIKDGEYWAMGLPVVIPPNISDDSAIIKEHEIGAIIEELNRDGYLKAIKEIDEMLKKHSRQALFNRIRAVAVKYRSFSDARRIYREIYL